VEIRNALRKSGYDVFPKYFDIRLNPENHSLGKLPLRDNINHYDTFVIRQEVERAVSGRRYEMSDFWELTNHTRARRLGVSSIWQEPYRRDVFATSANECKKLSDSISNTIDKGLQMASVIIITLGLIEVWRNKSNGLYVCQGPKKQNDPIKKLTRPIQSDVQSNKENLLAIIDAIHSLDSSKIVILTVSPVALGSTFSGNDVVVANMLSKCTLRAAAGEAVRERPGVLYWPSFEFAMMEDVFESDGRHVKTEAVRRIIESFLSAYSNRD